VILLFLRIFYQIISLYCFLRQLKSCSDLGKLNESFYSHKLICPLQADNFKIIRVFQSCFSSILPFFNFQLNKYVKITDLIAREEVQTRLKFFIFILLSSNHWLSLLISWFKGIWFLISVFLLLFWQATDWYLDFLHFYCLLDFFSMLIYILFHYFHPKNRHPSVTTSVPFSGITPHKNFKILIICFKF